MDKTYYKDWLPLGNWTPEIGQDKEVGWNIVGVLLPVASNETQTSNELLEEKSGEGDMFQKQSEAENTSVNGTDRARQMQYKIAQRRKLGETNENFLRNDSKRKTSLLSFNKGVKYASDTSSPDGDSGSYICNRKERKQQRGGSSYKMTKKSFNLVYEHFVNASFKSGQHETSPICQQMKPSRFGLDVSKKCEKFAADGESGYISKKAKEHSVRKKQRYEKNGVGYGLGRNCNTKKLKGEPRHETEKAKLNFKQCSVVLEMMEIDMLKLSYSSKSNPKPGLRYSSAPPNVLFQSSEKPNSKCTVVVNIDNMILNEASNNSMSCPETILPLDCLDRNSSVASFEDFTTKSRKKGEYRQGCNNDRNFQASNSLNNRLSNKSSVKTDDKVVEKSSVSNETFLLTQRAENSYQNCALNHQGVNSFSERNISASSSLSSKDKSKQICQPCRVSVKSASIVNFETKAKKSVTPRTREFTASEAPLTSPNEKSLLEQHNIACGENIKGVSTCKDASDRVQSSGLCGENNAFSLIRTGSKNNSGGLNFQRKMGGLLGKCAVLLEKHTMSLSVGEDHASSKNTCDKQKNVVADCSEKKAEEYRESVDKSLKDLVQCGKNFKCENQSPQSNCMLNGSGENVHVDSSSLQGSDDFDDSEDMLSATHPEKPLSSEGNNSQRALIIVSNEYDNFQSSGKDKFHNVRKANGKPNPLNLKLNNNKPLSNIPTHTNFLKVSDDDFRVKDCNNPPSIKPINHNNLKDIYRNASHGRVDKDSDIDSNENNLSAKPKSISGLQGNKAKNCYSAVLNNFDGSQGNTKAVSLKIQSKHNKESYNNNREDDSSSAMSTDSDDPKDDDEDNSQDIGNNNSLNARSNDCNAIDNEDDNAFEATSNNFDKSLDIGQECFFQQLSKDGDDCSDNGDNSYHRNKLENSLKVTLHEKGDYLKVLLKKCNHSQNKVINDTFKERLNNNCDENLPDVANNALETSCNGTESQSPPKRVNVKRSFMYQHSKESVNFKYKNTNSATDKKVSQIKVSDTNLKTKHKKSRSVSVCNKSIQKDKATTKEVCLMTASNKDHKAHSSPMNSFSQKIENMTPKSKQDSSRVTSMNNTEETEACKQQEATSLYNLSESYLKAIKDQKPKRKFKNLRCKYCPARFYRSSDLLRHTRRHTGEKRFKCNLCSTTCKTKQNLLRHMKTHLEEKQHMCDTCGKTFLRKSDLRNHCLIHEGVRPYLCNLCGKRFTTSSDYTRHSKTHNEDKPLRCKFCKRTFIQRVTLRMHIAEVHEKSKSFKCNICQTTCTRKSNLKKHMEIHTGEARYPCKICGKIFAQHSSLTRHTRTHTGEKPYTCDLCGDTFSLKCTLDAHRRRHVMKWRKQQKLKKSNSASEKWGFGTACEKLNLHGKKKCSFPCALCCKTFYRTYNLNRHRDWHIESGTFTCEQCKWVPPQDMNTLCVKLNPHVLLTRLTEPFSTVLDVNPDIN